MHEKSPIILYCDMVYSCLLLLPIDWKTFMSGQDMIWNRLPQTWYEAPLWETEVWGPTSAKNRKRTQYGWT